MVFDDFMPNATARCGFFDIGRVIKPPTGGVAVNRLVTIRP